MNIKTISRNVGKALLINALFMFISVIVSIIYGYDEGFTPLAISCIITFLFSAFPFIFGKTSQQDSLQDGYLTIVITWLLAYIFGMLPYVLYGGEFTLINAWFESVSGYTTTGSTILTDIESLPKSLLFWRSSTHFIGGLGVIVFLLLIMPDSSPFKLKLSHLELSSIAKDGYKFKSAKTIRVFLGVYIAITVAETICLYLAGMTFFDAVNHSFSTVATGGFSTKNISIMHYNSPAIDLVIMIFMTMAAMHFGIIFSVFVTRSIRPLLQPVNKYYFSIILIFTAIVALVLRFQGGYHSFGKAALDSGFQVISFLTTTGFAQADNTTWPILANIILLYASIHCGCSGSTTGGLKADRMFIAFKTIGGEFRRRLSPSSVFKTRVGSSIVSDETVSSVLLYIVLYFIVLIVSFLAILLCGVDIAEALSAVIASVGNVGPGLGDIGTMGNYAAQPAMAKFILTIDMFFGRVEIFPILIVVSMMFKNK